MMKKYNKIFKFVAAATIFVLLVFSLAIFNKENNESANNIAVAENQNETTEFIKNLMALDVGLETSFSLADQFVIDSENQISTDFCWLFSSLKCLETSLAIKTGEYYDFSETGMAYLNYLSKKDSVNATFNTSGNLVTFFNLASNYGLVLENDVSNDLMLQINEANYKNYSTILNFADKSFVEDVKVASFGINSYFSSNELSYNQKILILKKFIKSYGALFLAFGEGDGVLFDSGMMGEYSYTSEGHKNGLDYELNPDVIRIQRHAVCIIGWNQKGFIALNSWGNQENAYEMFCIPYDVSKSKLDDLMSTVRGFVVGENDIVLETDADGEYKNVFEYDEDVSLLYKFKNNIDLNRVGVKIFKGTQDVSFDFNVEYQTNDSSIKIAEDFGTKTNTAGAYIVRIYESGKLISTKQFLILDGTEVSSIYLERKIKLSSYELESLQLESSFLNNEKTTTFMINPYAEYRFKLNLSEFSECRFDENDPTWSKFLKQNGEDKLFEISTIKMLNISEMVEVWIDTNLSISKFISYDTNDFIFALPSFLEENEKYQGKLLKFEIKLNSTKDFDVSNVYTFLCFIGTSDGVNTNQNFSIHYELAGGQNSELNIKNYPNYDYYQNMTEYILKSPTKSGYEFLGWYSDSSFKHQVLKISKEFYGDLVLYAKWSSAGIDEYIKTSILIDSIIDNNGDQKQINAPIIYGDMVVLKYNFLPQSELKKYSFDARIVAYFIFNGEKFYIESLNNLIIQSQQQIGFEIGYYNIFSGNYDIYIDAEISINNVKNISTSKTFSFVVEKREVEFDFDNLIFEYDGKFHIPEARIKDGFVLERDEEDFALNYTIFPSKNVGTYQFEININNLNYKVSNSYSQTFEYQITKKKLDVEWEEKTFVYNSKKQYPSFKLVGLIEGDIVNVSLKDTNFVNAGEYKCEVDPSSISDKNYYVSESEYEFEILLAEVEIRFNDVFESLKVASNYRKKPTFEVYGEIFEGISNNLKNWFYDK